MGKPQRKYEFSWEVIGSDISNARPRLGDVTTLEVYRLFQFALRDILEQRYGTEAADSLFREAGIIAGRAFFERHCKDAKDIATLAKTVQDKFRDQSIGIVRFEKIDLDNLTFQLTVDEDLDCSGLPDTQEQICVYDEGFIKGILDSFTGKEFTVKEIDCWCSGERTCRFQASLSK